MKICKSLGAIILFLSIFCFSDSVNAEVIDRNRDNPIIETMKPRTTEFNTIETGTTESSITESNTVQSNTMVKEVSVDEYEENVADFNRITINDVQKFFTDFNTGVLYIGRPSCYYCRQFSPELKKFNKLINNQLNYYNIDGTDFDEAAQKLIFVEIGIPGTPTTMYIKDGKIISAWIGGEKTGQELYDFLFQTQGNSSNGTSQTSY